MKIKEALRYTTDTVKTLLAELQKPEHNEHRWGTDQSKSLRLYLADALQDAVASHTDPAQIKSLEKQAELLRNPEQHVVVRDGRVRAGKFTDKHITARGEHLVDTIQDWADGQAHITGNINWEDRSHQKPTKWHEDEELDVPEDELLPYGTQYVQNHNYDEPYNHHLHIQHLGGYLADHLNEGIDGEWEYINEMRGHSPEEIEQHEKAIDAALHTLRNAPYEEVDAQHPSERPQQ